MIGLEALLSDSNQEMTHKIALRMAGLYKLITPERASDVFRELKAIYKLRSKLCMARISTLTRPWIAARAGFESLTRLLSI